MRHNRRLFRWMAILGCLLGILQPLFAQDATGDPALPTNASGAETITPTTDPNITPSPTAAPSVTARPATPTITPTPRPQVAEFIFNWNEEMIYPQAVRFTLTVSRPLSGIAGLVLVIEANSPDPREITLNPATITAQTAETFTDFVYIWQVPPTDPLPFQEAVDYTWVVTLASGQTAVVPGTFLFGDETRLWETRADPEGHLDLIYLPEQINPELLRRNFAGFYELLAQNTGQRPEFDLVLSSEDAPFDPCFTEDGTTVTLTGLKSGTEIPCLAPVMDGVLDQLGYELFQRPFINNSVTPAEIYFLAVERFYEPIWQGREIPDWFKTGLAYFYLPVSNTGQLVTLQNAYRAREPYTLAQMQSQEDTTPNLWEAQSYGMVLFIANRIGTDGLYELARTAAADDTPFAESYETALGQPLAGLLPTWRNWIYSDVAAANASLNLYQGETPVPSQTPTVTPFPPSATPTPTNTFTPTATETPQGFRPTATPLPTRPPTETSTPAPPTITPRPAGFRDPTTATPTPIVVENQGGGNNNTVILVILVAALALLVAGLAFTLTGQRQAS